VKFEKIVQWDEAGPDVRMVAPNLFRYTQGVDDHELRGLAIGLD
jgi:hypothetical protein